MQASLSSGFSRPIKALSQAPHGWSQGPSTASENKRTRCRNCFWRSDRASTDGSRKSAAVTTKRAIFDQVESQKTPLSYYGTKVLEDNRGHTRTAHRLSSSIGDHVRRRGGHGKLRRVVSNTQSHMQQGIHARTFLGRHATCRPTALVSVEPVDSSGARTRRKWCM